MSKKGILLDMSYFRFKPDFSLWERKLFFVHHYHYEVVMPIHSCVEPYGFATLRWKMVPNYMQIVRHKTHFGRPKDIYNHNSSIYFQQFLLSYNVFLDKFCKHSSWQGLRQYYGNRLSIKLKNKKDHQIPLEKSLVCLRLKKFPHFS